MSACLCFFSGFVLFYCDARQNRSRLTVALDALDTISRGCCEIRYVQRAGVGRNWDCNLAV